MDILKSEELIVEYRPELRWAGIMFFVLGVLLGLGSLSFAYLYYARSCPLGLLSRGIILALLSVICLFIASQANQKKIVLSSHGILFPSLFVFDTVFRLERNWSDLGAVALEKKKLEDERSALWLIFHFRSKGRARLRMRNLSVSGLDTIFSACKKWGSTGVMSPELIELRRKLSAGESSLEDKALEIIREISTSTTQNETERIRASADSSLAYRYFMSYCSYDGQRFDETVIPYEPEYSFNIKIKKFLDRFPRFYLLISCLCIATIVGTASPYPLLILIFCFSLLPLSIGIYAAGQPTHIALSSVGLKLYWIHWFGDKSKRVVDWQQISRISTSGNHNSWLVFQQGPDQPPIYKLKLCGIKTLEQQQRLLTSLKSFAKEGSLDQSIQEALLQNPIEI